VHLRSEAAGLPESTEQATELAQRTGVRLKLSHFKIRGKNNWTLLPHVLERIEEVVHAGADVSFDVYPYDTTWQPLYTYLPKWATEGGRAAMLRTLADPVQTKKILSFLHDSDTDVASLIIASTSFNMRVVSKTFGQVAQNLGVTSEEALLEVLKNGGSEVLVFDTCLNGDQVEDLLAHPLSVVASDGGGFAGQHAGQHVSKLVHPRCFGSSANFLARMRHSKRIPLEASIEKLTSMPARVWGLEKRGRIAIGYPADLVLFDPLHIADVATIQNPYRSPQGIEAVWVNGELAVRGGSTTGVRAGQFLRKK
jgi:N-acyl-D-amino-acid deacylase